MARIAITGANSGIGLRAALQAAEAGHEVVALCRSVERGEAALGGAAEVWPCDLSSLPSVRAAGERLRDSGVDVLINNAATFDLGQKSRAVTADGHELTWQTNHLAPSLLAEEVMPALRESADGRLILIGSKGILASPRIRIRWDDVEGERWYTPTKAYYHSKLAQVMTAQSWHERSEGTVAVACLRVPAVRLDAAKIAAQPRLQQWLYKPKNAASVPPEVVAEQYVHLAVGKRPKGAYVDERLQECQLPPFARDRRNRDRLWALTRESWGA